MLGSSVVPPSATGTPTKPPVRAIAMWSLPESALSGAMSTLPPATILGERMHSWFQLHALAAQLERAPQLLERRGVASRPALTGELVGERGRPPGRRRPAPRTARRA